MSDKTDSKTSVQEKQLNILLHPAKSNDPRDLEPPQPGAGLTSKPEFEAFKVRGPFVPNREALANAGPPAIVDPVPPETISAELFPPEGWRTQLPPTIDVFLPGKASWNTYKKRIIEGKLARLGIDEVFGGGTNVSEELAARITELNK